MLPSVINLDLHVREHVRIHLYRVRGMGQCLVAPNIDQKNSRKGWRVRILRVSVFLVLVLTCFRLYIALFSVLKTFGTPHLYVRLVSLQGYPTDGDMWSAE